MEKNIIVANRRTVTGKQVGALRRQGLLPAVMYGHNMEPIALVLSQRDASRMLNGLTSSSIITIVLDGKEHAALVREKQRDFVRNVLLHVDFQIVSLTEKIRTHVGIVLTGLAPAVKDFNAVIVAGLDEIEVECLPQDLPERFIVDISKLAKLGDAIHVSDLVIPANVELLEDADEMIVLATSVIEEPVEEVEAVAGLVEPEVIEKGKKEEDEEEK